TAAFGTSASATARASSRASRSPSPTSWRSRMRPSDPAAVADQATQRAEGHRRALRAHEKVVLLKCTLRHDRDARAREPRCGRGHVTDHVEVQGDVERDHPERTGFGGGPVAKPAALPEPLLDRQRDLVAFADEGAEGLGVNSKKKGRFSSEAGIEACEPVPFRPEV